MTYHVIQQFVQFLNIYRNEFNSKTHIADYGGSIPESQKIVEDMMKATLKTGGLTDYNILDFNTGVDLSKPIKAKKADMGICIDVLEHTENPFLVAENICKNLKKGALLFVAAPWIWPLHYHPIDCWRFSEQGLVSLFGKYMTTEQVFMTKDCVAGEEKIAEINRSIGYFRKE